MTLTLEVCKLTTEQLYALIEEAGEGEEFDTQVEAAEHELDLRELATIEEWYAPPC